MQKVEIFILPTVIQHTINTFDLDYSFLFAVLYIVGCWVPDREHPWNLEVFKRGQKFTEWVGGVERILPVHLARFLNLSLKNMLKIPPINVLVIGNSKHCIGFIAVANYQIVFSLFFSRFKFIEENS